MEHDQQPADTEVSEQSAGTSESATETNEGLEEQGQEQESQPSQGLTPEAQEIVNKAIGRQHAKYRTEQQRANELQAKLEELEARLPQEQRPSIPDMPDPLDDDFAQRTAERDEAIREAAAFDARQEFARSQAAEAARQAQNAQAQEFDQAANTYMGRAAELGIDAGALQAAGNTVAAYGVSEELAGYILNDERGPLITQYLAGNLQELETLRTLNPMQAAVRLATVIVPKVTAVPANSGAPVPPDGLSGGGVPPSERGPDGTTYE